MSIGVPKDERKGTSLIVISLFTLITFLTRIWGLAYRPLSGDEGIYTLHSLHIFELLENVFSMNPLRLFLAILSFQRVRAHPPLIFMWRACSIGLTRFLGLPVEFGLRFPALIASLLMPTTVILIFKEMRSKNLEYFLCLYFIFCPFFIFFCRDAHAHLISLPFALLTTFFMYRVINNIKIIENSPFCSEGHFIHLFINRYFLSKNIVLAGFFLSITLFINSLSVVFAFSIGISLFTLIIFL